MKNLALTKISSYISVTIRNNKKIITMKLSKAAILALRGTNQEAKKRIAERLGVVSSTVYRWINDNDDNLTKAEALKLISDETGLSEDQLLEEVTTNEG